MSFTRRYGPASHRAGNGSGPNDRSNLVDHAHSPGLLAADTAGLLFRRTTSRWSPAAGHAKRTDAARVVRRVLLHVVADVPDRAVVARVDRRLRVVLPPQRIRLRCFAFHEDRLVQGESPLRVVRQAAGEALAGEVRGAAERVADADVAATVDRRTRHPP